MIVHYCSWSINDRFSKIHVNFRSSIWVFELPASLTFTQRSEIHQLAHHHGLGYVSRGVDENRFLTAAKPGVIIGERTLRKTMVSELVVQGQESQVLRKNSQSQRNGFKECQSPSGWKQDTTQEKIKFNWIIQNFYFIHKLFNGQFFFPWTTFFLIDNHSYIFNLADCPWTIFVHLKHLSINCCPPKTQDPKKQRFKCFILLRIFAK